MKAQTLASAASMAPLTKVTDDELRELQTTCSRIASQGGETGAIAERIMAISAALQELSARADRALKA